MTGAAATGMTMRKIATGIAPVTLALVMWGAIAGDAAAAAAPAAAKAAAPYYASIAASRARMRSGPGRTYPATWLYVRPDLPVRVIESFKEWRKVEDPAGVQGWMLANLVSTRRTALVQGAVVELREQPAAGAKILWRAEPGVVGRVSQCGGGWCRFDIKGQAGFVEAARLWGVEPGETIP